MTACSRSSSKRLLAGRALSPCPEGGHQIGCDSRHLNRIPEMSSPGLTDIDPEAANAVPERMSAYWSLDPLLGTIV